MLFSVDVKNSIGLCLLVMGLAQSSVWFEFCPVPDDWYRITVKDDARHILHNIVTAGEIEVRLVR